VLCDEPSSDLTVLSRNEDINMNLLLSCVIVEIVWKSGAWTAWEA